MKKLLLLLTFPCLLAAGDKSSEPTFKESAVANANVAIETVSFGVTAGATIKCVLVGGAALWAGDFATAGAEVVEAAGTVGKCAMHKSAWLWAINPTPPGPEQSALDKAHEESVKRAQINEERAGSRLRRCLSDNSRCNDLNGRGFSKRCNSPARDFAMINAAENDRVIATFLKWQKEKRGSV